LFERNPVIHALLSDGLARAALNLDCAAIVERMRLLEGSSIDWVTRPDIEAADVVYLDPMFPHRDKSALVKKEMQVFRTIVGDDADSGQLLAGALERARYRVVVKRPRKAPAIEGPEPTTRLEGKSSRYDVYSIRALPSR
jgi:16S rRNA (guanine1516-N2)-methyltransferase